MWWKIRNPLQEKISKKTCTLSTSVSAATKRKPQHYGTCSCMHVNAEKQNNRQKCLEIIKCWKKCRWYVKVSLTVTLTLWHPVSNVLDT